MNATPQERLALGALALLLAAGGAARVARGTPAVEWSGGAESGAALLHAVEDSALRAAARARPLAPGERLDPNTASADELARLPGVGPALAERIVARRAGRRRYRTLGDLDSVPGVGPALLAKLAPHLTLRPAPGSARAGRVEGAERGAPGRPAASGPVDLNRASAAELEAVAGVGPALARRIVESRTREGPFRSVDELDRVPGIGPAKLIRIRGSVRVSP